MLRWQKGMKSKVVVRMLLARSSFRCLSGIVHPKLLRMELCAHSRRILIYSDGRLWPVPELLMKTLKASLVGSAVGIVAWLAGITSYIWHAHPQWAGFFLTIAATLVMMGILPETQKQK